jgi:hypothetical protein
MTVNSDFVKPIAQLLDLALRIPSQAFGVWKGFVGLTFVCKWQSSYELNRFRGFFILGLIKLRKSAGLA